MLYIYFVNIFADLPSIHFTLCAKRILAEISNLLYLRINDFYIKKLSLHDLSIDKATAFFSFIL